jgi:hypothetical protein
MSRRVAISYPYVPTQVLYRSGGDVVTWGRVPTSANEIVTTGYDYRDARYLLVLEPPTVMPDLWRLRDRERYDRVFAHRTMAPGEIRIRYPWPIGWPELPAKVNRTPWRDREDCWCVVTGNKQSTVDGEMYACRSALIEECQRRRIHVYGSPAWDCDGYQGPLPLDKKIETMSRYRYAMALENTVDPGYCTEKLPDVLAAGCVPLYIGHVPTALEVVGEQMAPWLATSLREVRPVTEDEHERFLDAVNLDRIRAYMSVEEMCKTILSCL